MKKENNNILLGAVAVVAVLAIVIMIMSGAGIGTSNELQSGSVDATLGAASGDSSDMVGDAARALLSGETQRSKCVDSDNGRNYNIKGTTGVSKSSKTDYCRNYNSKTLVEYYCKDNNIKSENHRCPNGCADGVCKEVVVTPVCGDGILGAGEECEPTIPFDMVCSDKGFTGGLLTCNHNCKYDFSGCTNEVPSFWTEWFDRDDPSGVSDFEHKMYFTSVCAKPIAVECVRTNGIDYITAGQDVFCNRDVGFVCYNALNPEGCYDYKVRFLCPEGNNSIIEAKDKCTETDNGRDIYTKGFTTGVTLTGDRSQAQKLMDHCQTPTDLNLLVEYSCGEDGYVHEELAINCPQGCFDGACKGQPVTCTDSDGGINYDVKGQVVGPIGPGEGSNGWDYCYTPNAYGTGISGLTGTKLLEWYCNDMGGAGQSVKECDCNDGACIIPNNANSLSAYPEFLFDNVNDLTSFKGQLVIGQYAPTSDVMVALDIAASLFRNNSNGSITPLPLPGGIAVLDSQASRTKPSLIINGPCINSLAAWHLNNPANCANGYVSGIGRLDFLQKDGQTAIMVSGYTVDDIKNAKNVLVNWRNYESSFGDAKNVCVKQLSPSGVSVYKCDPLPQTESCGDGVLELNYEQCDPPGITASCTQYNPELYTGGNVICNQNCQLDLSQCITTTPNVDANCKYLIDNLPQYIGKSCGNEGYNPSFDTNSDKNITIIDINLMVIHNHDAAWCYIQRYNPKIPCLGQIGHICGNSIIDPGEQCDGSNLGYKYTRVETLTYGVLRNVAFDDQTYSIEFLGYNTAEKIAIFRVNGDSGTIGFKENRIIGGLMLTVVENNEHYATIVIKESPFRCNDWGYTSGTLSCNQNCEYDLSQCMVN